MPAPPELRDAAGEEGVAEVFREMKAKDPAEAHGHIAVTGEVEVNLQGAGHGVEPCKQHRGLGGLQKGGHQLIQHVGDKDLFPKPHHEASCAGGSVRQRVAAAGQLRGNVCIADDGPGDELGEHGHIGGQLQQVPLGRHRATVDIDDVAEHLKGVEADADGQGDLQSRQGKTRQRTQSAEEEAGVFAVAQQTQTQHCRENEKGPLMTGIPLHEPTEGVALRDGGQHEQQEPGLSPAVEHEAAQQQSQILPTVRSQEVEQQHRGQEVKEKGNTGKEHQAMGSS